MAQQFPSQYDCNNMDKDDMIMIKPKNSLYKWYRRNFLKNKIILKLNPNQNNLKVNEAYQEDCTLFTGAEINCIREYKQEIPCMLSETFFGQEFLTYDPIKYMQVGLNNTVIKFSDRTYIVPTETLRTNIANVYNAHNQYMYRKDLEKNLKYTKFTGAYIKDKVEKENIKEWTSSYCEVCGNPIIFKFNEDNVQLENNCTCGNIITENNKLTYNDFAFWYHSQMHKNIKKKFEDFWK